MLANLKLKAQKSETHIMEARFIMFFFKKEKKTRNGCQFKFVVGKEYSLCN